MIPWLLSVVGRLKIGFEKRQKKRDKGQSKRDKLKGEKAENGRLVGKKKKEILQEKGEQESQRGVGG